MAGKKKESAAALQKWEDVPEIPKEEQPYPVPEGWKWVKLLNIAKWGSGGTPSRKHPEYYAGNIAWLKTGELEDNEIYLTEEHITQEAISNSSVKIFPINTVVMAMYGATIGKLGILKIEATTNQACACASCFNFIFYKYLFFYLLSQRDEFIKLGKGGAQPNISQEVIKNYLIPVPTFEIQQRIVNRIESLFSKLDEAAEKVQAVIDSHEARKQAILHKAFSGELTKKWRGENEVSLESWEEKSIVDVTKYIKAGGDKPDDFQKTRDEKHNIPVIANGLENEGIIGFTSNSKNYENTLTIAARGTIGFPFLRNYDYYPVVRLIVIAPDDTKIIAKYLYYIFLAFPEKGTGSSIPQLTVPTLKEKIFPICPIEEQKIIVTIVNSLFSTLDSVYEESIDVLEKIKNINKTILHMAFSGKL